MPCCSTPAGTKEELDFEVLHTAPPQSAPDWIRDGPLANPASPYGYLRVDQCTLRSPDQPDVFALGDAANLPTSKTGAAIRKQAPVVAANVLAARRGAPPVARYDGYTSCPVVTAHNRMLLAEFDYTLTPRPLSRSSTPCARATTCTCSSATGCRSCIGTACSAAAREVSRTTLTGPPIAALL